MDNHTKDGGSEDVQRRYGPTQPIGSSIHFFILKQSCRLEVQNMHLNRQKPAGEYVCLKYSGSEGAVTEQFVRVTVSSHAGLFTAPSLPLLTILLFSEVI